VIRCVYFQTFSELIEAASKGDRHGVDQFSNDLVKDVESVEGETSFYTKSIEELDVEPTLTYCFGKAIGSDLGRLYNCSFDTVGIRMNIRILV